MVRQGTATVLRSLSKPHDAVPGSSDLDAMRTGLGSSQRMPGATGDGLGDLSHLIGDLPDCPRAPDVVASGNKRNDTSD